MSCVHVGHPALRFLRSLLREPPRNEAGRLKGGGKDGPREAHVGEAPPNRYPVGPGPNPVDL
jgi:hypothetical protein